MNGASAGETRRVVVVNADDFGLHPAINTGIERAFCDGIVRSTSFMTGCAATDDAVAIARRLPDLDLGLHFSLVGVPGAPQTLGQFALWRATGRLRSDFIIHSLRSQLDAMTLTHKLVPSHLDAHQHLHALPFVMRLVCQIAPQYDIRLIRLPLEPTPPAGLSVKRRVQAAVLYASARLARKYLDASGLRTTDHFAGMAVSGHLSPTSLGSMLTQSRVGSTEICCHPAANNSILEPSTGWGYDWEGELAAVCAPEIAALISRENIQISAWRDL